MKILITGSSGFVGKHLVSRLTKVHKIVKYDLLENQDILDEDLLLKKLKGVELVIHLAAFISAEESWSKPREYFTNNTIGTLSVMKCSIKSGVKKFIYFSSAAVKSKPLTPYGLSKKMAEEIVNLYSSNIKATIIRPENIYGLDQKASYGYVIHNFINSLKSKGSVNIYGNGNQSRDFIYVGDVVSAVNRIIVKNIYGRTISLGLGKEVKIKDLAKIVGDTLNVKVKYNFLEKRQEPSKSFADIKTLKSVGIDPTKFTPLQKGIKKLL